MVAVVRGMDFNHETTINLAHKKQGLPSCQGYLYNRPRFIQVPLIRGGSGVTSHVAEAGKPVGQFFMLKCDGIDSNGNHHRMRISTRMVRLRMMTVHTVVVLSLLTYG